MEVESGEDGLSPRGGPMAEALTPDYKLPRDTFKIVTSGRNSGLPHIVRVRYVQLGADIFALGGSGESDWVKNVKRNGQVRVRTETLAYAARAVVSQEDRDRVMNLFGRKYGKGLVAQWYGGGSVCVKIVPVGTPEVMREAKGEGDASKTFSEWRKEGRGYYGDVALAFDSASEEYDVTIGRNFINTLIRERSLEALYRLLRKDDVVLEIGAGTGAEAVQVARRVARVVATDISPAMVDLLRRKAAARRLAGKLDAVRVPAADIAEVKGMLPGGKVRVAYSFNGALNCEPRMVEFEAELASIVIPGGYFVCSIRNTLCLAEILTYAALLRYSGMVKRKAQPMMVSVGGADIPSTYYSVGRFLDFFRKDFEVESLIGLPALLPPAYLNDYYVRARRVLRVLERADRALGYAFPLNRLGDQTLFVLRRR
ncbi:MAG TPA: methyltransferase domain-containing protein [Nitrososphaerales archaeon]|nr:methyltransferase domain-containing protein [Nitrososphaerales archaeon]